MDVLAYLPPPLFSHLRIVCRPFELTAVTGWAELRETVRMRPADVVVADPVHGGPDGITELAGMAEQYPSLQTVLYTSLSPLAMQATVALARHGITTVVLRGFDDEPGRFRELIERLPANALSDAVLERLTDPMAEMPPPLVRAIGRLFRSPHAFHEVEDLASAAGMTRRSLNRWLDRAGLAPARTLLVGARVARAYYYMKDPGYLLEDVWRKVGYDSPRLFARQIREATGNSPSQLREQCETEAFLAQLTELLRGRGDQGDEHDDHDEADDTS